jgi:hypothetical protein
MRRRHWIWPFLVAFTFLANAPTGRAQDQDRHSQSHIEIPIPGALGTKLGDLLKNRAEDAHEREELKKLLEDVVANPQKYLTKKELDQFRKEGLIGNGREAPNFNDPKTQALLQKLRDSHLQGGDFQDPETISSQRERLKKLLEQHPEMTKLPPGVLPPGSDANPGSDTQPPSGQQVPPGGAQQPPFPGQSGATPPFSSSGSGPGDESELQERLRRFIESDLKDSEAWSEAVAAFRHVLRKEGLPSGSGSGSLDGKLSRLSNYLPVQDWLKGGASGKGMPSWPSFNKSKWSGSGLSSVGLGGLGGAESTDQSAWIVVLYLVMGVIAVLVIWKFLASYRTPVVPPQARSWLLGPWPVSPGAVATRQDLVLAFDYLALLLFGPAARVWNHRAIAAKLSRQSTVGSQQSSAADCQLPTELAAARLANLYEQARYAPPDEPLPERELEAARRDLYLLAGVTSA